jgi:hypothetical protein
MSVVENCNLEVTLRNFDVEKGVSSMKSSAFWDVTSCSPLKVN